MNNVHKSKKKLFFTSVFSFSVIGIVLIGIIFSCKPSFELKEEKIVKDATETDTPYNSTYEQEVLCSGYITLDSAKNYVKNVEVPGDADEVIIKFYKSDKSHELSRDNLLYEIGNKIYK